MKEKKGHPEESNQAETDSVHAAATFFNGYGTVLSCPVRSGGTQVSRRTLPHSMKIMSTKKRGGCF